MMKNVKRLKEVYNYIVAYKSLNGGRPPSLREIMNGTTITSTSVVGYYLGLLVKFELIEWSREGKARGISIPGERWTYSRVDLEQVVRNYYEDKKPGGRTWSDIKRTELLTRKKCEICGKLLRHGDTEAHHGLMKRSRRFAKYVTTAYNMQLVCKGCHAEKADTWDNTARFLKAQIDRYGVVALIGWLDSMPAKMKLSDRWKSIWRLLDENRMYLESR